METAIARAVGSQLVQGAPLQRPAEGEKPGKAELSGSDQGLTILPQGAGVLTRHITVTGVSPADGAPVKQEVYVDAHSGPLQRREGGGCFGWTAPPAPRTW